MKAVDDSWDEDTEGEIQTIPLDEYELNDILDEAKKEFPDPENKKYQHVNGWRHFWTEYDDDIQAWRKKWFGDK